MTRPAMTAATESPTTATIEFRVDGGRRAVVHTQDRELAPLPCETPRIHRPYAGGRISTMASGNAAGVGPARGRGVRSQPEWCANLSRLRRWGSLARPPLGAAVRES
jgi:hypothetical protein